MAKKPEQKKIRSEVTITETHRPGVVKMRFKEHKYYNDLTTPAFYAGEIYELEGAEWIQRWLKRGGEIVEGTLEMPKPEAVQTSSVLPPPEAPKATPVKFPPHLDEQGFPVDEEDIDNK